MTQSRLKKPFYRNGPSHRDGADVSFADIRKMFDFASIQIGRWVTKEEQQIAANLFFDALCDLCDILDVNTQVISLRGSLHLGFGTGGNKYSSAHYDSARHRLSLAKNAGGGALAHEWFHAFDHYIFPHAFARKERSCSALVPVENTGFASKAWLDNCKLVSHPLNEQLSDIFRAMFLAPSTSRSNAFVDASVKADKAMKTFYFAMPQEMAARAFEAVIQTQRIKNSFLVQGTQKTTEAKIGLYPKGQHLEEISHHILRYFKLLGRSVEKQNHYQSELIKKSNRQSDQFF